MAGDETIKNVGLLPHNSHAGVRSVQLRATNKSSKLASTHKLRQTCACGPQLASSMHAYLVLAQS